jgi:EAL domain-containing protein (putative c-di-GMP-specific phosphodiesterase class I)
LGIDCIVEGISEAEDREAAYQMGVRGASGKAIN